MTDTRILILLASCNGKAWLYSQIDAILQQESVDVKIEISDDLSVDGSRDIIDSICQTNHRLHLNAWPQASGSAGANFRRLFRHVDATEYDYVALADQDDIWDSRKLISAVEALQRTGAQGYSCAVQSFWPDGRERVQLQNAKIRRADFLFEGAGQGCTFVLTQAFFVKVRQFCIDYYDATEALHYHDWLIYLLARAWGMKWYFDQHPWIRYRQHGDNEIGSRGSLSSITKRVDMIRSGWFKKQVAAAILLFEKTQQRDDLVSHFSQTFSKSDSIFRRVNLILFFLRHGRRRLTDRVVMIASAAVGWV